MTRAFIGSTKAKMKTTTLPNIGPGMEGETHLPGGRNALRTKERFPRGRDGKPTLREMRERFHFAGQLLALAASAAMLSPLGVRRSARPAHTTSVGGAR
jgi:hypothetical protein